MSILFNRRVSLQVDPIIFNIRKINSKLFLNGVRFIRPKLPLFSRPPTLFFKDSDVLIKYLSFLWSLSILFRQYSYPVILMKILTELLVHHSSFLLSSPVVSSQAFGVDHIPFLVFNAFSCWCNSQSFTSRYSIVPECSIFLKVRLVIQDSFKIFRGCYLIQVI